MLAAAPHLNRTVQLSMGAPSGPGWPAASGGGSSAWPAAGGVGKSAASGAQKAKAQKKKKKKNDLMGLAMKKG